VSVVRRLLYQIGFRVDSTGIDSADKRVDSMTSKAGGLESAWKGAAAAFAAFGVGAAAGASVESALRFGDALGQVATLIPNQRGRLAELRGDVERLAVQYGKSATEITGALYQTISAFGDTPETASKLETAIKASVSGASDATSALSALSAITKGYGDTSAGTTAHVADLIFKTIELGETNFPALSASIGHVTPLAKTLGVSLEEVFAITATGTGALGSTSEVMTQISSAMRALIQRTPDMDKAFAKAFKGDGIKSMDQAIGKYGLVGTLQRVIATTDGTTEAIGGLFGRIEGMQLALALTGPLLDGPDGFTSKFGKMKDAAGALSGAYAAQTEGLGGLAKDARATAERFEALRVKVGEELAPAFGKTKDAIATISEEVGDRLIDALSDAETGIGGLAGTAEALDPLVTAITAIAAGVGTIATVGAAAFGIVGEGAAGLAAFGVLAGKSVVTDGPEGDRLALAADQVLTDTNAAMERRAMGALATSARLGRSFLDPEENRRQADLARLRRDAIQQRDDDRARGTGALAASGRAAKLRSDVAGGYASGGIAGAAAGLLGVNVGTMAINVATPKGTTQEQAASVASAIRGELDAMLRAAASTVAPTGEGWD
jgi:TP901 family phage tail tape measure protein